MDELISTSSTITSLGATQPFSHDVVQPLAALWPSLPALLLAAAVQRSCQSTQPAQLTTPMQHDAVTLAGWVQVLLTLSKEVNQQQTQTHTRGSKRKSISSEVQAATASELGGHMPTAAQLRACIGECLAALPKAELETATALKQVLLLLTNQVKQNHAAEYVVWGKTAEQLAALCQPETQADLSGHHVAAASTLPASEGVLDDACVLEAENRQQHTLQEFLAEDTAAASEPRWVLCFLPAICVVHVSHVYSWHASCCQVLHLSQSLRETVMECKLLVLCGRLCTLSPSADLLSLMYLCCLPISTPVIHMNTKASILACVLLGFGKKWVTGHHVQLVISHPSQTTMGVCHLSWLLSLAQQSWLCHKQPANLMQLLWHLQCIQQTQIKLLITLSRQPLPVKLCHIK